jgi:hypothetical protein
VTSLQALQFEQKKALDCEGGCYRLYTCLLRLRIVLSSGYFLSPTETGSSEGGALVFGVPSQEVAALKLGG